MARCRGSFRRRPFVAGAFMKPVGSKRNRARRASAVAAQKTVAAGAEASVAAVPGVAVAVAAPPPAARPRDRPPRLRFPLLLLLLVGPAAGKPARSFISVDSPAGLPNGCVNPITGDPMPQDAEWPDTEACRVLLCKLERGNPWVEVVGCSLHSPSPGCTYIKAENDSAKIFPNCCGRYVCTGDSDVGLRSLDDFEEALVVYAV